MITTYDYREINNMNTETRWKQRLRNFQKVMIQLEDGVKLQHYSNLEKAGLIKTVEFTFELAWKTLKDLLESEGYDLKSPRIVIKQAFKSGYIDDGDSWLELLEKRNYLTHSYDDIQTNEAIVMIKEKYYPLLLKLSNHLKTEVNQ